MLPSIRPAVIGQGVSNVIISDSLAIIGRQQVAPYGITVGIGYGFSGSAQCVTGGVDVLF